MMQKPIFDEHVSLYLQGIKPAKRGLARQRQYEQEKEHLIAVVPPAMYDTVIRSLADQLHL